MEGTIRTVCKVGGKVEFAKPGSLPNDGKVIDDVRKYTEPAMIVRDARPADMAMVRRLIGQLG